MTRASKKGIDHLGIQVDDTGELEGLRGRMRSAALPVFDEGETVCCYAKSDKTWVQDPGGVAWETYRTMEDAQIFAEKSASQESAFCAPSETTAGCCG